MHLSKPDTIKLAVYGTLRRGGLANHLMRGAVYIGTTKIRAKLYALGGFPGIRFDDNTVQETVVDVYEVTPETLRFCDQYEGYKPGHPDQSLFVRRKTKTLGGHLNVPALYKPMEVEVYEFNADIDESRRILSGDWFDETARLPLSA